MTMERVATAMARHGKDARAVCFDRHYAMQGSVYSWEPPLLRPQAVDDGHFQRPSDGNYRRGNRNCNTDYEGTAEGRYVPCAVYHLGDPISDVGVAHHRTVVDAVFSEERDASRPQNESDKSPEQTDAGSFE